MNSESKRKVSDGVAPAGFGDGRLVPFADSLWTATTPIRFAGSWFSHVMTAIRLDGNGLLLHSPCRPSPALVDEIASIGRVDHIVSPNWFHDLYLAEYRRLYPSATFWGPRMLRRQRGSALIDCALDNVTRPPWDDQMPHVTLSGLLTFDESLFFHRPSRTLIVADLLTNACAGSNAPVFTRLGYRFLGLDGRLMVFPILRWFGFANRRSLREAAQRIVEWNPERLITGHGTPLENDAAAQVQAAFR